MRLSHYLPCMLSCMALRRSASSSSTSMSCLLRARALFSSSSSSTTSSCGGKPICEWPRAADLLLTVQGYVSHHKIISHTHTHTPEFQVHSAVIYIYTPCTCLGLIFTDEPGPLQLLHSHDPKDLLCFTLREVSSNHKYGITWTNMHLINLSTWQHSNTQ